MFGTRTVAQRDVEFNVNLGQFRAQLGEADVIYKRTTGSMSTEALRLSVGQEKVNRAIARFGPESLQARAATVQLRNEQEALALAAHKTSAALLTEERSLGRLTRGAVAGSGLLRGVGSRSLAFASTAFLGGTGIIYAFRTAIKAAEGLQVSEGRLRVALKDTNNSWDENKAHIDAALDSQVKLTAFTRDELTAALANNVRRFGDVSLALRANAIDADVARAKGISLADAQVIVQRASLGQSRSLLALGIQYTKTTANVDALKASTKFATKEQLAEAKAADALANRIGALDAVNAKFHGNAAAYLKTSAGRQALFNAELQKTEEVIGAALLPLYDKYLGKLTAWLEKSKNQKKIAEEVKVGAEHLAAGLRTAGHAAEFVKGAFDEFAPLFHGAANEVKALTAALILFKLRGVAAFKAGAAEIEAASIPLIAAETAAAGGAAVGGVAARVAMYTGAGAAAAGGGAVAGKAAGFARFIGPLAFAFAQSGESGSVKKVQGSFGGQSLDVTESSGPNGLVLINYRDPVDGKNRTIFAKKGDKLTTAIEADLKKHHPGLSSAPAFAGGADRSNHPGVQGPGAGAAPPPKPGSNSKPLILGLTEKQQTGLLRAQGTKSPADDLRELNKQLGILNQLVLQHGLNPAQLNSLLQQRDSVLSQIDSITSSSTSSKESAAKKAAAARKKLARERAKALVESIRHDESVLQLAVKQALLTSSTNDDIAALKKLERFYKKEANDPRLTRALRDAFGAKDIAERLALKKLNKTAAGDFGKLESEFLQAFSAIQASTGSNVRPPIVQHLHFNAPPTGDGHREAITARIATQAQFD